MPTLQDLTLPPLARIGDPLAAVDTPALLLDLLAFERNVVAMQAAAQAAGVALRPHAKAHKCVAIAQAQRRAGAEGICCQKVSEALPFVNAGCDDVLISNEVCSPAMLALLAQMARRARISVCVDHAEAVVALAAACAAAEARVEVLVEIDVGQQRCGVADAAVALALARLIEAQSPWLRFKGLQAYQGAIQHLRSVAERRTAAQQAAARAAQVRDALRAAGLSVDCITGGGSGSAAFDLHSGVYTELQPGSYVFMDADYARNEAASVLRFEHALFLHSRVISEGQGDRLVLDAGLKTLSAECGPPWVWGAGGREQGLEVLALNDEHAIVQHLQGPRPRLGDTLRLVPGHCDPTLNLHDQLVVLRDGRVEALWAIEARGLSR